VRVLILLSSARPELTDLAFQLGDLLRLRREHEAGRSLRLRSSGADVSMFILRGEILRVVGLLPRGTRRCRVNQYALKRSA
jgi:hypothetical protein